MRIGLPGVSGYAKLVGQNVADQAYCLLDTGELWNSIRRKCLYDCATSETYKVFVGATNPSGAQNFTAFIDDIKVQRTKTYGVAVSAYDWDPAPHPGVTRYGPGTNAVITNGVILQGQTLAQIPMASSIILLSTPQHAAFPLWWQVRTHPLCMDRTQPVGSLTTTTNKQRTDNLCGAII